MSWCITRLKRIASVLPSNVDKNAVDGQPTVRLCNYTDVYFNESITDDLQLMQASASAVQLSRFRLRAGDVIVTKDSETADDIGVPAYVPADLPDVVCGYHLAIVRPHGIEPKYLYWTLRSLPTQRQLEMAATGVTRVGLRTHEIENLRVQLPPLAEQRRISDRLDAEHQRVRETQAALAQLDQLLAEQADSLLEQEIARADGPPTRVMHLVDSARPVMYGIVLPGEHDDAGVPLIKGGDVHAGRLDPSILSRVAREIEATHRRSRVREGDLIYAIRGSFGDVQEVPTVLDGANLTQDVARVAPARGVDRRWLRYALTAPSSRAQAEQSALGAAVQGVNIGALKRFVVPAPIAEEQRRIADRLDAQMARLNALRDRVGEAQRALTERQQALITALVTGQLDVAEEAA